MRIKTQIVTFDVDYYAVPRNVWDVTEDNPETHEVKPYLHGSKPWQDEAVLVATKTNTCQISGQDLYAPTVKAVEEAINLEKQTAMDRIIKLEQRLQELLAITHDEG